MCDECAERGILGQGGGGEKEGGFVDYIFNHQNKDGGRKQRRKGSLEGIERDMLILLFYKYIQEKI